MFFYSIWYLWSQMVFLSLEDHILLALFTQYPSASHPPNPHTTPPPMCVTVVIQSTVMLYIKVLVLSIRQ